MARWKVLLIAALYLIPQAAAVLHDDALEQACGECVAEAPETAFECAGEHCGDSDHHHHHHDRHHHPGACRICSAAAVALLDAVDTTDVALETTAPAADPDAPSGSAKLLRRPIRAPPGDAPFPG